MPYQSIVRLLFSLFTLLSASAYAVPSYAKVKLSQSGICHNQDSPWFARTNATKTYPDLSQCIDAGGRLPKGQTLTVTQPETRPEEPQPLSTKGNTNNPSFNAAKRQMREIFKDHKVTFYCQAGYDSDGNTQLPAGFSTPGYQRRSERIEWEHIVPAENFGRAFEAWHFAQDDQRCLNSRGRRLSNRDCALKHSEQFRYMHADRWNLVPAIGAVNAYRSNYRFTQLSSNIDNFFGTCPMKIDDRAVEPPEWTRGQIARTYLYFDYAYPDFTLSSAKRQLFDAWNKQYPVQADECVRGERILRQQGNRNPFVNDACNVH
ncbi:endonuclease [Vibrio sp. WXL103]|uniref:endonuclease n=1 Tax=Vibrio sp. WXL103 TaxID=3450710 RepID=UPI003EC69D45